MTGTVRQLNTPEHFSSLQFVDCDATFPQPSTLAGSLGATSTTAYDKTTQAVLAFLQAPDHTATKTAFDHLLAMVFKSRGRLFLTEPGLTPSEATHEFLEAWLVEKLMPYSAGQTCYDAAARGEFRYLAREGRLALIDELRRRGRSDDALDRPMVRMDADINTDEGDAHSWHDLLGTDWHQNGVCPLGTKPFLEPSALQQKLQQCREEITEKLGEPLSQVLSIVCELFPDQLSLGDVTRGIAKARAVSEQTARKLHHALARKLISLRGDPVVRGLVEIIRSAGDPIHLSIGAWDPQSQGVTPN